MKTLNVELLNLTADVGLFRDFNTDSEGVKFYFRCLYFTKFEPETDWKHPPLPPAPQAMVDAVVAGGESNNNYLQDFKG